MLSPRIGIRVVVLCSVLLEKYTWASHGSSSDSRQYNSLGSFPMKKSQWLDAREGQQEDCFFKTLWPFLSFEGLSALVEWTAREKGIQPSAILRELADYHGLDLQEREPTIKNTLMATEPLNDGLAMTKTELMEDVGKNDVTKLLQLISVPRIKMNSGIEIPTPDGLPRALLVLLDADGGALVDRWIDLTPRTSFLDFIRTAEMEAEFGGLQGTDTMLKFKLKKVRSRKCLALAILGPLRGSSHNPLMIQIFSSSLEVLWKDSCLPKVDDLLIYPGYVVIVSPWKE